jgi:hypothetical protein
VRAPTEGISADTKGSIYTELEHVFNEFHKHHMKNLLGDFNAKVGREDTFKLTIENGSLHETRNDSGVRVLEQQMTRTSKDCNAVEREQCETGADGGVLCNQTLETIAERVEISVVPAPYHPR